MPKPNINTSRSRGHSTRSPESKCYLHERARRHSSALRAKEGPPRRSRRPWRMDAIGDSSRQQAKHGEAHGAVQLPRHAQPCPARPTAPACADGMHPPPLPPPRPSRSVAAAVPSPRSHTPAACTLATRPRRDASCSPHSSPREHAVRPLPTLTPSGGPPSRQAQRGLKAAAHRTAARRFAALALPSVPAPPVAALPVAALPMATGTSTQLSVGTSISWTKVALTVLPSNCRLSSDSRALAAPDISLKVT